MKNPRSQYRPRSKGGCWVAFGSHVRSVSFVMLPFSSCLKLNKAVKLEQVDEQRLYSRC